LTTALILPGGHPGAGGDCDVAGLIGADGVDGTVGFVGTVGAVGVASFAADPRGRGFADFASPPGASDGTTGFFGADGAVGVATFAAGACADGMTGLTGAVGAVGIADFAAGTCAGGVAESSLPPDEFASGVKGALFALGASSNVGGITTSSATTTMRIHSMARHLGQRCSTVQSAVSGRNL
jgi:hypothetical protein